MFLKKGCVGVGLLLASMWVSAATQPNIVWIMAEDIGLDLECYGMAGVKTPVLNKLASEGAMFTRVYCANPICSPSRSAMMTGVHQTRINAQHHRSNRDVPLLAPYKPITSFLRDAGYTCILGSDLVYTGGMKIDCNFKTEALGEYDGVTHFGLFDKERFFSKEDQPFFNQIQLKITHRGNWWNQTRAESKHPVSEQDVVLPPFMADTPEIRHDWATYLDTIEYADNEVGLLLEELKKQGVDKNTYVIFIGDNGRCNMRGKGYLAEPGIHIPMIVWGPGIKPGSVIDELICTTDISATILHIAGAEIPDYITSKPVFATDTPQYRTYVRSARDIWDEIDECSRSITTKRFSYIKNLMPEVPWDAGQCYLDLNRPAVHVMRRLKAEGKLTQDQQLFFADEKPVEELYDLENDPYQLHNLAANPEYSSVLKEMQGLEDGWEKNNRDFGLEDLGKRTPEAVRSVPLCEFIKKNRPDLWARLESGELMDTKSWSGLMKKKSK